jgi:hypothetical protein
VNAETAYPSRREAGFVMTSTGNNHGWLSAASQADTVLLHDIHNNLAQYSQQART